jgi:hypothetical protein
VTHPAENDAALWIDTDRPRADKVNAAVREVEEALDELTRLATWGHLTRSAESVRQAADRLVVAVAEARVIPPAVGQS